MGMVRRIKEGQDIELVVQEATGIYFRTQYADQQLAIIYSLRDSVLMLIYLSMHYGHPGGRRLYQSLHISFY